ncbi:MAG: response regulator transcription factor [Clostridiales bacterium]|nr:response regulator transcription factor [Clostridiales bacterium]
MAVIWTVEDEENISILLMKIIASMGHTGHHSHDGTELAQHMKKGLPDLLLLDLMLRGKNGFQILADWKQDPRTKHIPVIILSARSTEMDKVKGLDLGAEDYVTKPFSVRELKARINTALRRVSPAALRLEVGKLVLEPDQRLVHVGEETISLTVQEFELLHYLAKHAGMLVTRSQLLADVWGYQSDTDTSRTVDYHIRALRKKLGDDALNPKYIETVHGSGYRLLSDG